MIDKRRHSVDLPITKALIALRRVKSLKDPSTNSMSKFSAMLDNVAWETSSSNDFSMQFLKYENDGARLQSHLRRSMLKVDEGENFHTLNALRDEGNFDGGSSDSASTPEDSISATEMTYKKYSATPERSESDALSCQEAELFADEDQGCGISCCWTRAAKFRDFEIENHPLLSRDMHEVAAPVSRKPRSLDQKYEPRSFSELVGQNVVVRSLVGAILSRRIASLYLFHGPRGTGKTSASRIFAAALNCLAVDDHKPCGNCQECVDFASGRARDIREVDSASVNRGQRIRSLIKEASSATASSRFRVFIIDECHLLHEGTWMSLLNTLERLPHDVVIVTATPYVEKVPRSAVTRSQHFHFPKIKDADISRRLEDICFEEGLGFDKDALGFIASMANGSLRDANMMLDQLTLLGERITLPLARELIGVVSDDELLSLLDLALSSDTSKTVIRARELMNSRIDPIQLVSQLANLIMDIISGKSREPSEIRANFVKKHASETDAIKLSYALKVLTDTEKQLRVAKNQTTWLTAALLQLSSMDPSSVDANNSNFHFDTGFISEENKMMKLASQTERLKSLELIWEKATEQCRSLSFKHFLKTRGKLSSLCFSDEIAVAVIEFCHPAHVSKAERSWKLIASSLQSVISRNVEVRIILDPEFSASKHTILKKVSLGLFNCSKRMQENTQSSFDHRNSNGFSDPIFETRSPDCGCQGSIDAHRGSTLRSVEGNVLRSGAVSSKENGEVVEEDEEPPRCFPKTLWHRK